MPTGGEPASLRLTAPGALLVALVPTVLGALADVASGVGYGALTGVGFAGGCVAAALRVRRRDLVAVAVCPPLVFVAGVALAEGLRSWGTDSWIRNEVVALTAALSGEALWVAVGTVATVLVAAGRGLRPPRGAGTRRQSDKR